MNDLCPSCHPDFALLVRQMREEQTRYFRTRSRDDLVAAKKLEQRIDWILDAGARGPLTCCGEKRDRLIACVALNAENILADGWVLHPEDGLISDDNGGCVFATLAEEGFTPATHTDYRWIQFLQGLQTRPR